MFYITLRVFFLFEIVNQSAKIIRKGRSVKMSLFNKLERKRLFHKNDSIQLLPCF